MKWSRYILNIALVFFTSCYFRISISLRLCTVRMDLASTQSRVQLSLKIIWNIIISLFFLFLLWWNVYQVPIPSSTESIPDFGVCHTKLHTFIEIGRRVFVVLAYLWFFLFCFVLLISLFLKYCLDRLSIEIGRRVFVVLTYLWLFLVLYDITYKLIFERLSWQIEKDRSAI